MKKISLIIVLSFMLSGCGGLKRFECPAESGFSCKSLQQVDKAANKVSQNNVKATRVERNFSGYVSGHGKRIPEEILDIYLQSYVTKNGTLHHAKKISVIANNARWK